jgi:FHA domain
MPAQFQVVMRSGPNVGKVYPLELEDISIGRDTGNTIAINDAEISRRHARLALHGSAYVIQDLGSTNGTFVNGVRVTGTQVLNPGDTISFGENISLSYEAAYDANATVISSARAPRTVVAAPQEAAPAPMPAPAPVPAPAPAPAYSGRVPTGPLPPLAAPAKKKSSKAIIIVVVVVIVLILCLCVGVPFIADALKLDCRVPFKWFFNIVGPMFGYSSCP